MEITKQHIDNLNALIKIKVIESDYADTLEKALKNVRQKVSMPGFRQGMVPASMVKKMYGKSVLSDEVSKMVVDRLFKYLEENKIEYLGNPLPNNDKNNIDWDQQKEFEFFYDLGLSPEFKIEVPEKDTFTHYKIEADQQTIDEEVEKLRNRFGRSINAEEVTEKDMVMGSMIELNDEGTEKEGGLNKSSYIIVDKIEDPQTKSMLLGKKPGDDVVLDPRKAYKDELTASIYLGIKQEEVSGISHQFKLSINSISRLVPAEINQEFFDRVFGKDVVSDEVGFRNKVAEVLQFDIQQESNARLLNDIRNKILEKTSFELPDQFLQRWIRVKNAENKNFNPDTVEAEYNQGRDVIRWELIRKKIADENNIQVTEEEMMSEARRTVLNRVNQMGYSLPDDKIDELAQRILANQEEGEKIVTYIIEVKALEHLKSLVKIDEKPIGYQPFLDMLQNKAS
jgi:trigger factor